jgi:D-3-phosphoglycerate dehydrogenase
VLITRLSHHISKEVIKLGVRLKVIATATTGLDHIDLDAAQMAGIKVISLKGEVEFLKTITATAEHTFGLMLSICRNIPAAFNDVLKGNWNRDNFRGVELKGKTLGIVGFGRLGKMVSVYGSAFGMRVIINDPYITDIPDNIKQCGLDELLQKSDFVSIHVPLNSETFKMIGQPQFSLMKRSAYLINTSRGDVIDEDALIDALTNKIIAGAAIDVISGELLTGNDSRIIDYARANNNLIITPHIGGATIDSMQATEIYIADKIKLFFMKDILLPII